MDNGVLEMRLVVTALDEEAALAIYRDVLGMPELGVFSSPGGRVTILEAGRATLELGDPGHAGTRRWAQRRPPASPWSRTLRSRSAGEPTRGVPGSLPVASHEGWGFGCASR